jgi:hypothetical protein
MRYVSIDLETTGIDPDNCQILEFGAVIDDLETPIEELPTFRFTVMSPTYKGEPYALHMHSKLFKRIASKQAPCGGAGSNEGRYDQLHNLGRCFSRWLVSKGLDAKNFVAAGKNFSGFDARFLNRVEASRSMFQWNHRVLDPASMFAEAGDETLPDTNECVRRACETIRCGDSTARNDFATITGEAHTVLYDAKVVCALVREGFRRQVC